MLSSQFDFFSMFDRLKENFGSYLPESGGILGSVIILAVVVGTGLKFFAGRSVSSGVTIDAAPDADAGNNADSFDGIGNGGGEEERVAEQCKEQQKEEEQQQQNPQN